jgi:hypothetical protein
MFADIEAERAATSLQSKLHYRKAAYAYNSREIDSETANINPNVLVLYNYLL